MRLIWSIDERPVLMLDGPVVGGRHLRIFWRGLRYSWWPYWRGIKYGAICFGAGPIGVMWWPR